MISIGSNIRSNTDPLTKVTVKYLYDAIRNPKPSIEAKLRQLRIVREINPTQYADLKRQLPYFVCAMFNPPYRHGDNFAFTEYFIIDIDHLADKDMDALTLRERLAKDDRVLMCFVSPGGDGLKIMMKLKERCYDAALYKVFYRLFAHRFSLQYGLQQVIDTRTCDVVRACFISIDEGVYFNPQCEPVCLKDYLDADYDINQALTLKRETERRAEDTSQPRIEESESAGQKIDQDAIALIRKTLNPNAKLKNQKAAIYVPKVLDDIMNDLRLYIEGKGVVVDEVLNISYGKKMRFKVGLKKAEVNLFFGKKGFSVVQSPRTGTDAEMNALMAEVVEAFIVEKL